MGAEHDRECFNNPLILYSEHKRVLGDAIARGDEKARQMVRAAYWQGLAMAWIPALLVCLLAALAGFNLGLRFVQ
jgi:hypothetical protein